MHEPPAPGDDRAIDRLLARPLSEGELDRNARMLALPQSSAEIRGETLIVFERCGEMLALPAASVARVVAPLPVHRVPHRPGPVFRGVASERGELRLVASLEALLGMAGARPTTDGARGRMMLVEADDGAWLFEVDSIVGVRRSDRSGWMEPPPTVTHRRGRMSVSIVPVGARRAALLDPARIVRAFNEAIS